MTRSPRLAGLLVFALGWLGAIGPPTPGHAESAPLRSGAFEPPRAAPDFVLPATSGEEFRLSRHRGKVIALAFGYTSCVDVCPTVLADLAQMRARLGEAARQVQMVYVTVDPERDTSGRLRAYTELFDRSILGLTGTPERLAGVWRAYGVSVIRQDGGGGPPAGYRIHHSASVFLIDTVGRLRVMAPFGTPLDDIVADVRTLLQERAQE